MTMTFAIAFSMRDSVGGVFECRRRASLSEYESTAQAGLQV